MPTVEVANFVPSAMLVAVMVTIPAELGAVNVTAVPDVLVVGENDPPPVDDQVTPALVVSFVSVALTESFCETVSPPRRGLTLTVMLDPPAEVVALDVFEYPLKFPARSVARTR